MAPDPRQQIHAKVVEIARQIGKDARTLRFDQEIPASGVLDSAGIMELMMWFEAGYGLSIPSEDLTIANFGTIDAMERYLRQARGAQV